MKKLATDEHGPALMVDGIDRVDLERHLLDDVARPGSHGKKRIGIEFNESVVDRQDDRAVFRPKGDPTDSPLP